VGWRLGDVRGRGDLRIGRRATSASAQARRRRPLPAARAMNGLSGRSLAMLRRGRWVMRH
jgi:hypothetical protein